MVARVHGAAHLDVLGDARSPLRLVRDVTRDGLLQPETIERTLWIVRGFVAVAKSAGAERTVAVATAAVREASNGEELIQRARSELGIPVEIADGEEEARLGFSARCTACQWSTASFWTSAAAACSWSTSAIAS